MRPAGGAPGGRGGRFAHPGPVAAGGEGGGSYEETLAASGNALLREMLERLRERTAPFFGPEQRERQAALWADHARILTAIVAGDEGRADALAADHVRHAVPANGDCG